MEKSNLKPSTLLIYILAFQTVVCISILLDIPFIRQILGFLFFIFIPGFVLLRILKQERFNIAETILFSFGLSIAFLMLMGFTINSLGSLNLISKPLSTKPLAIIVNIAITLMCFLSYFLNKEASNIIDTQDLRPALILAYTILPLIGVVGIILVNAFNNNLLLISVMILIPLVFVLGVLNSKLSQHYPLIILSIALTLLLSNTLITKYPYGDDINFEYNVFTLTNNMSSWNPNVYYDYDQFSSVSMLSVTVLPTMLSNLLNIDGIWIFKIIFPIIFSLVPLGLYHLYQIQWGKKTAFISVIFFMANYEFFHLLTTNAKPMIAELFYVLLFLIMLRKSEGFNRSKWIISIFFVFALVVSHYSINYIYLFTIIFTWLCGNIFLKNKMASIRATDVAFICCFTFFWYLHLTYSPFYRLSGVIQTTFANFIAEFFSWEARGVPIQTALWVKQAPSTLHMIGTAIHNLTSIFIVIGFILLLVMWRKGKISSEYSLIVTFNVGILFSAVVIPRFAGILEIGRLYHVALIVLSPLFVLGAEAVFSRLLKPSIMKGERGKNAKGAKYSLALISIVLVAFFLFQTGFVYEIMGDPIPSSISLSRHRMEHSYKLIHESDAFSAMWLSNYGDVEHIRTYTDVVSLTHVLTSYSTIRRNMFLLISNTTKEIQYSGIMYDVMDEVDFDVSYIYLSKFNVVTGKVVYDSKIDLQYSIDDVPILKSTGPLINRIYSNSASQIYYRTP